MTKFKKKINEYCEHNRQPLQKQLIINNHIGITTLLDGILSFTRPLHYCVPKLHRGITTFFYSSPQC